MMTDLPIQDWLEGIHGLIVKEHADPTGNPITRLKISITPVVSGLDIGEFAKGLRNGDPSIVVRDRYVDPGFFEIDPCNMSDAGDLVNAALNQ